MAEIINSEVTSKQTLMDCGTTSLRIRRATIADVPAIVAVERAVYEFAWSRSEFETLLRDPRNGALLVELELDGRVVAFILWRQESEHTTEIVNLATTRRSDGIGTKLLNELIVELRLSPNDFVSLHVRESNVSAIGFYQRIGFQIEDEIQAYWDNNGESALLMSSRVRDLAVEISIAVQPEAAFKPSAVEVSAISFRHSTPEDGAVIVDMTARLTDGKAFSN